MVRAKQRILMVSLALLVSVSAIAALAVDDFILTTRALIIPERGPVESVVLLMPSNHFTFIPPPGWRFSPNKLEKKVTLQSHDLRATVTIKINTGLTNSEDAAKVETLREQISTRYAGVKIVREFESYTSGCRGPAFDAFWSVNPSNKVAMRMSFIPIPSGMVEFNLTTLPDRFPDYHRHYANLLTSFRVESVRGKP